MERSERDVVSETAVLGPAEIVVVVPILCVLVLPGNPNAEDRKSTRLNSSHWE